MEAGSHTRRRITTWIDGNVERWYANGRSEKYGYPVRQKVGCTDGAKLRNTVM